MYSHHRHLTLDNELQALLVSDATTEKAAASLAVRVGKQVDNQCVYPDTSRPVYIVFTIVCVCLNILACLPSTLFRRLSV